MGGMEAMSHSPVSPTVYQSMTRGAVQPPPPDYVRRLSMKDQVSDNPPLILSRAMLTTKQAPPPIRADPMSLSSIMSSGADNEPPAKPLQLPSVQHQLSQAPLQPPFVKQERIPSPAPAEMAPQDNGILHQGPYEPPISLSGALPPQHFAPTRELPVPDEAEVEAALAHIETKQMNDLEGIGSPIDHYEWKERSLKRGLEVTAGETVKRKVC
jgi:DNA helicase INO80